MPLACRWPRICGWWHARCRRPVSISNWAEGPGGRPQKPSDNSAMDFEFFSHTDTGRVRTNNEDAVALDASCGVAVLADGMGGYAAGEVASGMACDFIKAELGRWLQEAAGHASDGDVKRAMDICVDNANRAIFSAANSNPTYAGMGTTLVLGVF